MQCGYKAANISNFRRYTMPYLTFNEINSILMINFFLVHQTILCLGNRGLSDKSVSLATLTYLNKLTLKYWIKFV